MKKIIVVLLALLITSFTACRWFGSDTASTLEKPPFVIVNVLDKKLYDDAHIKGSIQVDYTHLKDYAEKNWDKENTEIIVYCANYKCTASWQGAQILTDLGFKKAFAYEGGTAEAHQRGLTEGPAQEAYLADFKIPEGYEPQSNVKLIDVEDLKKKMEEFALTK